MPPLPLFLSGNQSKRSVVLDLHTDHGREALRRLVRYSDVFAQAFRSGVIDPGVRPAAGAPLPERGAEMAAVLAEIGMEES